MSCSRAKPETARLKKLGPFSQQCAVGLGVAAQLRCKSQACQKMPEATNCAAKLRLLVSAYDNFFFRWVGVESPDFVSNRLAFQGRVLVPATGLLALQTADRCSCVISWCPGEETGTLAQQAVIALSLAVGFRKVFSQRAACLANL